MRIDRDWNLANLLDQFRGLQGIATRIGTCELDVDHGRQTEVQKLRNTRQLNSQQLNC